MNPNSAYGKLATKDGVVPMWEALGLDPEQMAADYGPTLTATERMVELAASGDPRQRKRGWRLYRQVNGKGASRAYLHQKVLALRVDRLRRMFTSAVCDAVLKDISPTDFFSRYGTLHRDDVIHFDPARVPPRNLAPFVAPISGSPMSQADIYVHSYPLLRPA